MATKAQEHWSTFDPPPLKVPPYVTACVEKGAQSIRIARTSSGAVTLTLTEARRVAAWICDTIGDSDP